MVDMSVSATTLAATTAADEDNEVVVVPDGGSFVGVSLPASSVLAMDNKSCSDCDSNLYLRSACLCLLVFFLFWNEDGAELLLFQPALAAAVGLDILGDVAFVEY